MWSLFSHMEVGTGLCVLLEGFGCLQELLFSLLCRDLDVDQPAKGSCKPTRQKVDKRTTVTPET